MNTLLSLDRQLLLFLNGLGREWMDPFWILMTREWTWIPLYVLLIYLLYKKFPVREASLVLMAVVIAVTLTDQLSVHAFKEVFQRLRPCHEPDLQALLRLPDGCGGMFGFVSSHAANTFGVAVLLGLAFRKAYPGMLTGLLIWAAVVSLSRSYLGAHYPGDLLGGALLGVLVGRLVWGATYSVLQKLRA